MTHTVKVTNPNTTRTVSVASRGAIPTVQAFSTGVVPIPGPPGPRGPAGPPAPAFTHHHQQSTPATLWRVTHNFGTRPTIASLTDHTGTEIDTAYTHADENTLHIHFAAPTTGDAHLNA